MDLRRIREDNNSLLKTLKNARPSICRKRLDNHSKTVSSYITNSLPFILEPEIQHPQEYV
jgi:hypothetical protein